MKFTKTLLPIAACSIMFSACSDDDPIAFEGPEMVEVSNGSFQYGNTGSITPEPDQLPVNEVTISALSVSKYEITQELYEEIMDVNPSTEIGDNLPVNRVSWRQAVEFCNELSLEMGIVPAYTFDGTDVVCDFSAPGFRLPTEAEWEYIAKAGTTTDTYGGDLVQVEGEDPTLEDIAWYNSNSGGTIQPVGLKMPNDFGVYDIIGNICEWTWDYYDSTYYQNMPVLDPTGPTEHDPSGKLQTARGGAFRFEPGNSTAFFRAGPDRNAIADVLGFRVVQTRVILVP